MTEDKIDCPEEKCDGKLMFMLRQKGGVGEPFSLDARCRKCDFQEDDIQEHRQGIFCLGCNEYRDDTMVCVPCVTKKLGIIKERDVYPMTSERTPTQMDCRNVECKFYRENGDCVNPAPAITLNPDKTYVCWSKEGTDKEIDESTATISKWVKKCPTSGCERPMTVINVYWLRYPNGDTKLQVVYYCYEHEVMLIGDLDTKDLGVIENDD